MKHKSPATKSVEWMQQILPPYQWMIEQSKCMSQRPANKLIKPPRRRIKIHNPIFWLQKWSVNNKVWWSAKIWLDIHAPFSRIQMKATETLSQHKDSIWSMFSLPPDYLVCLLPIILTEATYFYPPWLHAMTEHLSFSSWHLCMRPDGCILSPLFAE